MTLPPYNDQARCPKCGAQDPQSSYYGPRASWDVRRINGERIYWDHPISEVVEGEFLMRQCTTCAYQWPEAVLDE